MSQKIIVKVAAALLTTFLSFGIVFSQKIEAEDIPLPEKIQTKTIVTDRIHIDRIYRSMVGPQQSKKFQITDQSKSELLWLTGASVDVVNKKGSLSHKYLCHSNLSLDNPVQHNKFMSHAHGAINNRKFLSLNQGQSAIEFPPGFAVPLLSNEKILFYGMALNNQPLQKPVDLKFKVTLSYVNNRDLVQPMKVLRQTGIDIRVPAQYPNCDDSNKKNNRCGIFHADETGNSFNFHWLVAPGRHSYWQTMDGNTFIPFDTTAHFIAMHMHPYAESMELIDRTTGETLFKGYARHYPNNQDIESFESFSSEEGIPLYRNHKYETITVYNNITDKDIDAMAILYIYLWDKKFDNNKIKTGTKIN